MRGVEHGGKVDNHHPKEMKDWQKDKKAIPCAARTRDPLMTR
jgi:hypothetical protein